ncbi:MAG: GDP-L-fucose synthase [Rhodospirillales bacterium]|nr:GDP-L-fucose synthase [Rhodospirillales bacterium]MBO6785985.1 GDP-L-fucose synthase [Rhodospirillales bacterium]
MDFELNGKRVYVAGHTGLVGAAMAARLTDEGCDVLTATHGDLDLTRQADTEAWFSANKPDAVVVAAAHVGGIRANATYPAKFLYDNAAIAINVIEAARQANVGKLLYLSAACTYPKLADQPIVEDALLTGPLEPTNEWYALAKITGMKLCQAYRAEHGCNFISAQPSSVYGPGDKFDPEEGHVVASMISKFHAAKESGTPTVELWGTGTPVREFMYIDDLADALVYLLKHYADPVPINVGTGQGTTIRDLADMIKTAVGYEGTLTWDTNRPDGMPKRMLDSSRLLDLGWEPTVALPDGLAKTYAWYRETLV